MPNYLSSPLSTLFPETLQFISRQLQIQNLAQFTLGTALLNSTNFNSRFRGLNLVNNAISNPSNNLLDNLLDNLINNLVNNLTTTGSDIALTEEPKVKNKDNTYKLVNAGLDTLNSFMPSKSEYNGLNGGITSSLDSTYDSLSNSIASVNPLLGGIMKGGSILGKGLNALGVGTDSMTKTDAVLGSSFLSLTPVGLINSLGALRAHKFDLDKDTLSLTNGAYDNFSSYALSALNKSNKKYGLFSQNALKRANRIIDAANILQNVVKNIVQEGLLRTGLLNLMSAIDSNLYQNQLTGGYDPNSVRIGRSGMLISYLQDTSEKPKKDTKTYAYSRFPILKNISFELLNDNNFQPRKDLGDLFGNIEYMTSQHDDLPYYNNYSKPDAYKGKSVIVYNNNVTDEDIALDALSHGLREQDTYWNNKIIPALKREWDNYIFDEGIGNYSHKSPEEWKSLSKEEKDKIIENFYKSEDYDNIVDGLVRLLLVKPELRKLLNYSDDLNYINQLSNTNAWKQALDYINTGKIPQHKNGGSIITLVKESIIELVNPDDVPEFKNGGSINVIPNGALHARKHDMDLEGITLKGIPVVSEDSNGNIELHAEIERNEVILRLEVTLKLEELEKKFYSEESTLEEKDECALEAGKLLVYELLENTIDNTGLLNEI